MSPDDIAFLTQHGKEAVVAPLIEPVAGGRVRRVEGIDTDTLGTFTREVPRAGTQLEAARRKARLGMERLGLRRGLGSEGAFGPDPFTGLFAWNVELLVYLDDEAGLEIVGRAEGRGAAAQLLSADWHAVQAFAVREGFPGHGVVMRPLRDDDPRVRKDLHDEAALRAAFEACRAEAGGGPVFVETDLRAFANPTRMATIGRAAQDLATRLSHRCPACAKPGWGVQRHVGGLPCAACRTPTGLWCRQVWSCGACGHEATVEREDLREAEPRHCPSCNP
jgi:hypothetical protein